MNIGNKINYLIMREILAMEKTEKHLCKIILGEERN